MSNTPYTTNGLTLSIRAGFALNKLIEGFGDKVALQGVAFNIQLGAQLLKHYVSNEEVVQVLNTASSTVRAVSNQHWQTGFWHLTQDQIDALGQALGVVQHLCDGVNHTELRACVLQAKRMIDTNTLFGFEYHL